MPTTKAASTTPPSSPTPERPNALMPGPRASAFITLHNSALSSTLKAIPYESFAACFPLIAVQAPDALRAMWNGMCNGLESFGRQEFEEIMRERNVVERLNALEGLVADAKRRREILLGADPNDDKGEGEVEREGFPMPLHTLQPAPLLAAHVTPLYISQQSQLNAKLQTVQSRNAELIARIRTQREEIEQLLALGERLVRDVEGAAAAVEVVGGVGEGKLASESRRAEGVLGVLRES